METTTWMHRAARSVQGSHVFEISGYSLHRDVLCAYANVPSAVFRVGGYQWQIAVYPGGIFEYYKDYLSVYVYLVSKNVVTRVRASVQLSLVDVTRSSPPHTMTTEIDCSSGYNSFSGIQQFKKRSELEGSPYLRDDRLTIECIITLDKESLIQSSVEVSLPPSDIIVHLQKLLQAKEGTDVIFEVQGEVFPAHRTVLAMRSPVFKAELYGPMREKDMSRITISDMQPAVFEILLHFIYTDSLSTPDDLGHDEYEETIMHLLVAADRYAMERLKMICEDILRSNINVKTVVTTLVLADQHRCIRLDDACIQFIASLSTVEMDDVMASRGYAELKETSPSAIVALWEKTYRFQKSKSSFHIGSSVALLLY
jgi:speckle-type POZ protein